jgi:hypothetical protein
LAISRSLEAFLEFIPNVLAAILVLIIGWIVARFLRGLTMRILQVIQLEPFAEKVGLAETLKKFGAQITPAELVAELVKWGTFLVFVTPAAEVLGLSQLTVIINQVISYIPNVLVAVLIIMFGVIFSDLTAQFVRGTAQAMDTHVASALAVLARYSIVTFAFLAALTQLGIAERLISTLFTGFVAMLAIAGGLAFGLGGKDLAAELLESLKRSLQDRSDHN